MLALRRQHHQETAIDLTDRDATQRRITGLYTRAAEQLGNDTAPVRLGGLYALEGPLRTTRATPGHRQRGLVLPRSASSLITCVSTGSRVSPRRGLPARTDPVCA